MEGCPWHISNVNVRICDGKQHGVPQMENRMITWPRNMDLPKAKEISEAKSYLAMTWFLGCSHFGQAKGVASVAHWKGSGIPIKRKKRKGKEVEIVLHLCPWKTRSPLTVCEYRDMKIQTLISLICGHGSIGWPKFYWLVNEAEIKMSFEGL